MLTKILIAAAAIAAYVALMLFAAEFAGFNGKDPGE